MTTKQRDLATSMQLGRLAREHPDAAVDELARLALAELEAELARFEALRAEVRRRQAIIRRTGRATGLPPLTPDPTARRGRLT